MTDTPNDDKTTKGQLNKGIRSIHSLQSDRNIANVLRPNFGGPLKRADTNNALTLEQIAKLSANLRNINEKQFEKKKQILEVE